MTEIIDKQDEIMVKLNSIQKFQQQIKQQYTFVNEGIDGINMNTEKYYNGTIKKMTDLNSKTIQQLNNIDISSEQKMNGYGNNNGVVVNEMTKLTTLTTQLTQDMSAASMLSVMREEYNNMRREKDEMRAEVAKYRKENEELALKKQQLEEEAINTRESKRRTIKNLVDELNDMRDQIFKMSQKYEK